MFGHGDRRSKKTEIKRGCNHEICRRLGKRSQHYAGVSLPIQHNAVCQAFFAFYGWRMNYYKFHIGDYRRDTSHLSLVEHGIYRQLIDQYYLSESPLPEITKLMRSLSIRTSDDERSLASVLSDFFEATDGGYVHKRCDLEIDAFHQKSTKARESANERWDRLKKERDANAMQTQCEGNANHKPLTTNQEPKEKKEKTFLSDSDEIRLSALLFSKIKNRNPKHKEPNFQSWGKHVDLMLRVDKRTPEEIERVICWCQEDLFWQNNVLGTDKLRKQFDRLVLAMGVVQKTIKETVITDKSGNAYSFQ